MAIGGAIRRHIESYYNRECDIYEYRGEADEDGITLTKPVKAMEGIKCRVVKKGMHIAEENGAISATKLRVRLLYSPEINIKPGSVVEIKNGGGSERYKCSGLPFIYDSHAEAELMAEQEWA